MRRFAIPLGGVALTLPALLVFAADAPRPLPASQGTPTAVGYVPLALRAGAPALPGTAIATPPATPAPTHTPTPSPTATLTPTATELATSTTTPPAPFTLTSAAFDDGDSIPTKYTYRLGGQCSGENYSPPLAWVGAPAGTRSLALIMDDPDGGDWVHWVLFDMPATVSSLPEAVGGPVVGTRGINDFGDLGYSGPCPPSGTHRYYFRLHALDTLLGLPEGATRDQVGAAMSGHVLAEAEWMGRRSR